MPITPDAELLAFRCNICGTHGEAPRTAFGRESASCMACGSTVRMRAVVHLLSQALFGRSLAIDEFPQDTRPRGIGLSDWIEYAERLARKLDYTNTFYHCEPQLDITDIPDESAGSCDFVISTDVFEHVVPPVSRAFEGARRLLKPGGTLILTVPFSLNADTVEHFPLLHDYRIEATDNGNHVLHNRCADGSMQRFESLVFHGGPGETLEMRVFCKDSLERDLRDAGFVDIRFHDEPVPEFGIFWQQPWSLPVTACA